MLKKTPWWLKIGAKVFLSRLPVTYSIWRRIGIFQHGTMLDSSYAMSVFGKHWAEAKDYLPRDFTLMELGPGDSLATAAISVVYGARKIWLVDVGPFASTSTTDYRGLFEWVVKHGGPPYHSIQEMLCSTNANYLTAGLTSLRTIPDNTVDFVFSQAVLEHVPLAEFSDTIRELYRIQKPGAIATHRIDLQDHLDHSLNSLRFSAKVWESNLFRKSGFYTNRLRASQIQRVFVSTGYKLVSKKYDQWATLPISRNSLHPVFRGLSDDDLLISGFDLVAQKT